MKTELKPEPENACNGFEKICKFLMLEKYNIFIYIKKQIPKSPKWCNRKVSCCPEITNLNTNSATTICGQESKLAVLWAQEMAYSRSISGLVFLSTSDVCSELVDPHL